MGVAQSRLAALVASAAVAALGAVVPAPAAAYPYTLDRFAVARVPLSGAGCGDTPQRVLQLPAGARGFRAFPNEPSDKPVRDAARNIVADPVGAALVAGESPYYLFTFRTSQFVCSRPDLYPGGAWTAKPVVLAAEYHLTQYSTSRDPYYCGDVNYVYHWVRAYRVSCWTARRLADPKTNALVVDDSDSGHGLGFLCRLYDTPDRHQVRVACRRGASLVLFYVYRFD